LDYTCLRHAPLGLPDGLEWVAIGYWEYDGVREWCVEYWDARGVVTDDSCFETEAEAQACADREFGLKPEDWRDGPQPFDEAVL
jgi:hypothetical protein